MNFFVIMITISIVGCTSFVVRSEERLTRTPSHLQAILQGDASNTTNIRSETGTGYQFGDVSRSILKRATKRVNDLTGKEKYEFGDLTRYFDQQAKNRINQITGRDDYQFGDLTRWADEQIKASVNQYTKKEEYQFGDITAEILRRVQTGEYELNDVVLALRVLVSAGISLTPIAGLLPIKVLLAMVNFNLTNDVGGRATEEVARKLEERLVSAIHGQTNKLSEFARREVIKQIAGFVGKSSFDDYRLGDVTKKALSLVENNPGVIAQKRLKRALLFTDRAASALNEWDQKYLRENHSK